MDSAFRHYEILGPRSALDQWMSVLQDLGTCHLADAMHGLEGQTGIGRPAPTFEEMQAEMIRSEAGRALRAVARVLPPSRSEQGRSKTQARPNWQLGVAGGGADRLAALHKESNSLAAALRVRLEAVQSAEDHADAQDARLAAAAAVAKSGGLALADVRVLVLPQTTRGVWRLVRRLRKAGMVVLRAKGRRARLVVVRGASEDAAVAPVAALVGARTLAFSEALVSSQEPGAAGLAGVRATLGRSLDGALRVERETRAALLACVAEHGPRARTLLDALEDADVRMVARKRMASTEHVAAARIYVRRENAAELREQLAERIGDVVVVRPLAEADDEPTVPRQVATVPLGALLGLRPTTFGEVPMASVLALFTPLAVAAVWADVAGGLVLLLAGALLGAGAGLGSPRRDTALLGQVSGLLCLVLGVLAGRAFGAAGVAVFGSDWGLAKGLRLVPAFDLGGGASAVALPFIGVLHVLGQVALAVSLWGLGLALHSWQLGRIARARTRFVTALHYAGVAGLAAAVLPGDHGLQLIWPLAPAAFVLVLVLGGLRALLFGLCLDLVGVLRLVGVGGGALLLFQFGFDAFADPSLFVICTLPPALLVGALAVLADPAHLAMGVPYDLSLGGRRFTRPYQPLTRRVRLSGQED